MGSPYSAVDRHTDKQWHYWNSWGNKEICPRYSDTEERGLILVSSGPELYTQYSPFNHSITWSASQWKTPGQAGMRAVQTPRSLGGHASLADPPGSCWARTSGCLQKKSWRGLHRFVFTRSEAVSFLLRQWRTFGGAIQGSEILRFQCKPIELATAWAETGRQGLWRPRDP